MVGSIYPFITVGGGGTRNGCKGLSGTHSFTGVDVDTHVANEWDMLQQPVYITPTRLPLYRTNLGTSLFWMPPYLLTLLIIKVVSLATPLSVSGFEQIFVILIQVMDWVYGWLTFYVTYRALALLFPRDTALIATLRSS